MKENKIIQPTFEEYFDNFYGMKGLDRIILPGHYYITEGDMDGRCFSDKFKIKVTKEITPTEAYEQLKKLGYRTPWNYITIRLLEDDEIQDAVYKFVLPDVQITLF